MHVTAELSTGSTVLGCLKLYKEGLTVLYVALVAGLYVGEASRLDVRGLDMEARLEKG